MTTSRYSAVTRRAFLSGLSAAAIVTVAGCATAGSASAPPTGSASTSASGTASTGATTSATASGTGRTLPTGATATVSWTFASGGGMSRNPYMAVWLEDADGAFVKTLALYHRANGDNWLNSLATWYASSGGTDTTTSGTVPAGSFTATWDGTAASGDRAAQGTYYVCIESMVEHGSESLIRQEVTFGTRATQTTLTPSGNLTAASVAYAV